MAISITTAIESEFLFAIPKADKQELVTRRYKIELLKPYPELSIKISVGSASKLKQDSNLPGYKAASLKTFIYQDLLTVSFDKSFQVTVKAESILSEPISGSLVYSDLEVVSGLTNNAMVKIAWQSWLVKLNSSVADLNGWDQWLQVAMKMIDSIDQSNDSSLDVVVANTYLPLSKEVVLKTIVDTTNKLNASMFTVPLSLSKVSEAANKLLMPTKVTTK